MLLTELVERANKSLDNLLQTIENIPPGNMAIPESIGKWSVKDVLNHIIIWEEEAAKAFEIWKIGIEPDWLHITDLDEFNNSTVEKRRKIPLSKIMEQLQLVHNGVIENIKSVADSEYNSRGGIPGWLKTLITTHINEHTNRIEIFKCSLQEVEQGSA